MNTALKKINARVKVLQKRNPKKKRSTLQKQAGREWKAGKLKAKRKPAAKKKAVRRKPRRVAAKRVRKLKRTVPVVRRKYKARKTKVKAYKAKRYRRVSGAGKSMLLPILAVGALGLGAYLLLKPKPAQTMYQPTGNPVRDNSAQTILAYATAAGLTINAISNLIASMNSKSDSELQAAAASAQSGQLPAWIGI